MEISLRQIIQKAVPQWWVVAVCVLLGGLGGWLFHRGQAAEYEAIATFSVTIDFAQSGPIDEREQDQAISAFQAVISSPDVLQQVRSAASERGVSPDELVFGRSISLERRQSIIELHARNADPQRAVEVANLWADRAYAVLVESYGHSLQAWSLRQYLVGLNNCVQNSQAESTNLAGLCAKVSLQELKQHIQQTTTELESELQASRSLLPSLMFDLASHADFPQAPISYARTWLILAGVLIGFVVGGLAALIWGSS